MNDHAPTSDPAVDGLTWCAMMFEVGMENSIAEGNLVSRFVICINNESNPASLVLGKVYRTLPDAEAEARHMLRIIDEDRSEPDGYLYPESMFAPIQLPEVAVQTPMPGKDGASRGRGITDAWLSRCASLA